MDAGLGLRPGARVFVRGAAHAAHAECDAREQNDARDGAKVRVEG